MVRLLTYMVPVFVAVAIFFFYRWHCDRKTEWLKIRGQPEKEIKKNFLISHLQDDALAAGVEISDSTLMMIAMSSILVGYLIVYAITGNYKLSVFGILLGIVVPKIWEKRTIEGRRKAFELQLEDVLARMSSCLRAGMNTQQALEQTVLVLPEPSKEIFMSVLTEINTGKTLPDAIRAASKRVRSRDMNMLSTAIVINDFTGGSLSQVLDQLQEGIRDQRNFKKQLVAAASEGTMTSWVLGVAPFLVIGYMRISSPESMSPLFNTLEGNIVFMICTACILIGVKRVKDKLNFE